MYHPVGQSASKQKTNLIDESLALPTETFILTKKMEHEGKK